MFFSVKKRTMVCFTFLLLSIGLLAYCGAFHEKQMITETLAVPIANKVIVIDAGHGGFDAGASVDGIEEKSINLAVAEKLQEYVELGGGVAILTRNEDVSTAEKDTNGKSAKKSDLTTRKNLSETSGADVFVSIHMNKFPQSQYKGAQVFYGPNPADGQRLGEGIQESLREVLQDGNQRMAKKTDGSIFILKDTSIPSVIVECGFLSNPEELALLTKETYQQKLAWGIYLGLVRYFNS